MPERELVGCTKKGEKIYAVHYTPEERELRDDASRNPALFKDFEVRTATKEDFPAINALSAAPRHFPGHFGGDIKKTNFEHICDRIDQRAAKGNPPVTEQLVVIEGEKIVGFARFQHQDGGVTQLSHMFLRASGAKARSPVDGDPKPVFPDIAGILERAACERAQQQGMGRIEMVTCGRDESFPLIETFPAYSFKEGVQSRVLTKELAC